MNEEEFKVVTAMFELGGSFVKALSLCFSRADATNFKKLKDAFPEYWEDYRIKANAK